MDEEIIDQAVTAQKASDKLRETIKRKAADAEKNYYTFEKMVEEAIRRDKAKNDYNIAVDRLTAVTNMGKVYLGLDFEGLKTTPQQTLTGERVESIAYELNKTAHSQLAKTLGIPVPYYNRLLTNSPKLLTDNINSALIQRDDDIFVRELDGQIRAILPQNYNVMDDARLLPLIKRKVDSLNAQIIRCWMTDTETYVMAQLPVDPSREITVGDTVSIGVIVSNSEVGMAPLEVLPQIMRLQCSNGLIIGEAQGGYTNPHKSKNKQTDRFDNELQWATIETLIDTSMSPRVFDKIMDALRLAQTTNVSMNEKEVRKLCLQNGVPTDIATEIIAVLKDPNKRNVWELINVITAVAREMPMTERVELENKSYRIMASLTKPLDLTSEPVPEEQEDDEEEEDDDTFRDGD
jgi:hypothetical protein